MKLKNKINILILLFFCSFSYAQINQYSYKRELQGITKPWHKIILPEEIFGKVSPNLVDMRIYGINSSNDTIEASYMLQLKKEKIVDTNVNFKLLNSSHNEKGYYFTLEVPTEDAINELKLDFNQPNFDWKINLEGSQNQQEWYKIVNDYRILSIKNSETNFQFTKVTFPTSKYRFFRLLIKSDEKPDLSIAKIAHYETNNGSFNNYTIENIKTIQQKEQQITQLEINLKSPVPVSSIKMNVKDNFDFYRPITIEYLADSLKTEQGWKYQYEFLTSGTLNSIEKNEFKFESTILQKLKISIYNHDNKPLTIDTISVNGYVHELIVRFTEPATYFLTYGNKNAIKSSYDIERFTSKIPNTLTVLNLGQVQLIDKKEILKKEPLFKNKNWLWAVMTVIILLLGWFSVKMMQKK
ncbi:DUF3999 family protein [Lutibacter sp.]|uniref:DUF3999 family protein n=1 Tax=Lutibacter sp. TaxID=1925666 RepID=UPI0035653EB5